MARMQDRIVVVTGAANGLGRATAIRLAQEGASLVIGDIEAEALASTAAEITALDRPVHTLVGDLTEPEAAEQAQYLLSS